MHRTLCYKSNLSNNTKKSLMDRGANGGIAGDNVCIIDTTGRFVNIEGIDNQQVVDVPIVTAGGVTDTIHGPIISY